MSAIEKTTILIRPESVRTANEGIAAKAARLRFASRIPMLCECDNPDCSAIFLIHAEAYKQARTDPNNFLTAPAHSLVGAEVTATEDQYWVRSRRFGQSQS